MKRHLCPFGVYCAATESPIPALMSLGRNDTGWARSGRTVTAADDRLTRVLGRLSMRTALLLAGALYAGIGLLLPLVTRMTAANLIAFNVVGAALAMAVVLAWLHPFCESRVRHHLLEWTTDLRLLSAPEFEWLVGELLRRERWDVVEVGREAQPDGNVDLALRRPGERRLVQCKRWASTPVRVDEIRKFAGTLMRERLPGKAGTFVTLSHFTKAGLLGIELLDGGALIRRIEQVRFSEPCPRCSTPMRLERSAHGWWFRCPRFPECDGKRDLAGAPDRALELLLAVGH
jgi:hypothetical protein